MMYLNYGEGNQVAGLIFTGDAYVKSQSESHTNYGNYRINYWVKFPGLGHA